MGDIEGIPVVESKPLTAEDGQYLEVKEGIAPNKVGNSEKTDQTEDIKEKQVSVAESDIIEEEAKVKEEILEASETADQCITKEKKVEPLLKHPDEESKETDVQAEKIEHVDCTSDEPLPSPPEQPPTSMHFVKIARIPKDVLNFMVREESEGTVRINLTQLKYFMNDLWKMGKYVNGSVWDECDFPKFEMAVPKCAQKFTIVSDFNVLNAAAIEQKMAANIEKYKEQEKQQYSKMTDHQKRKTWKDLNREYVIKDNVITTRGSPVAEKSQPVLVKQQGKEDSIPSQIKPADPLPVAEATGKSGKAPNKHDGPAKTDASRKRSLAATVASTEGQSAAKKPDNKNPENGGSSKNMQPKQGFNKNNPLQLGKPKGKNSSFPKKNGNKAFNIPQTTYPNTNKQHFRNSGSGGSRLGNPWHDDSRGRNDYSFIAQQQYESSYNYQRPMGAHNVTPYASRDIYSSHDPYYDSPHIDREVSMMDRERRLLETRAVGGNFGATSGREYRTSFDEYTSRNYNAQNYPTQFPSNPIPRYANDSPYGSQMQPGYGSRY